MEERLRKFRERAIPLVTDVCRRAIADAGLSPSEISKLVVVSSTGFIGPGLDCEIIESLGLRRDMDRSLIGFMGCAAAMNGFRICNDYVRSRGAGHHALLCCVELSSVHTTFDDDANDAVLHAIFADGCAAAVLAGGTKAQLPPGTLAITDDYAWLMQDTQVRRRAEKGGGKGQSYPMEEGMAVMGRCVNDAGLDVGLSRRASVCACY